MRTMLYFVICLYYTVIYSKSHIISHSHFVEGTFEIYCLRKVLLPKVLGVQEEVEKVDMILTDR